MKSEKILINKNDELINQFKNSLNEMLPYVGRIVTEFNKLGVGQIKDENQLNHVYANAKNFYEQCRVDSFEMPEVLAMANFKKADLAKMRDLPDPQPLFGAAAVCQIKFPHSYCSISDFIIDENGNVVIDQTKVDSFVEENTMYAETADEISLYQNINELATSMQDIADLFKRMTGENAFRSANQHGQLAIYNNFISCDHEVIGQQHVGSGIESVKPKFDLVELAKRKSGKN